MENILDKIKEKIKSSDLTDSEKEEFQNILTGVDEKELSPVAGLFSENISWVRLLFDNYRFKKEALVNNDFEAVEKILKQEKEMLQKMEG
jgi:hypothetical protein